MKILIVEDNVFDADLTRRKILGKISGCTIDLVETVKDAKKMIGNHYDIVLLDYQLPDGVGIDLVPSIINFDGQTVVIMLTGSGNEDIAVAALKAGADDYLVKKEGYLDIVADKVFYHMGKTVAEKSRSIKTIQVLYVEHHQSDVDLTLFHFKRYAPNIKFTVVSNGNEAINKLRSGRSSKKYDVILMDYKLPGLDAIDVTKVIRQELKLDIAIVIITGQGSEELAIQALKLGANEYLVKRENYLSRLPSMLMGAYQRIELNRQSKIISESEEMFRSMFENHAAIKLIIKPETGHIFSVNKAAAAYYGWSIEELKKMSIFDLNTLPENEVKQILLSVQKEGKLQAEFKHRHADGSITDVMVFSSKVIIRGNEYLHAVIYDITKAKQAEKQLELLNAATEQSPISIIITNNQGEIEYANNYFTLISGYSLKEVLGKNPRVLNSGTHSEAFFKSMWDTITSEKIWQGEICNKKKNGELYWENVIISPIRDLDGTISHFIGIKQDVTEKRKLLHELLDAKEKAERNLLDLNRVQKIAHIGSWNLNIATNEVFWSEELYKMYGFDPNLPPPPYTEHKKLFTPESWETLSRELEKTSKLGIPYELELKTIRDDGSNGWMWVRGETVKNDKGKTIGLWGAAQDISQRKYIEEELLRAKEKAEESDRLKSAFLANMSHEIRTPMNGILGFTNLMLNPDLSDESKDEYIHIIQRSGQRLLNTVNDIVEISKIEAGMITINYSMVCLDDVLKYIERFFQPEAWDKGLALNFDNQLKEKNLKIKTDQNKLEFILNNLVKNAIKFTDTGHITISCKPNNEFVEFCVEDTGIGIPADRQKAVFNRFEQADIDDVRAFQGSGLGLAIAKSHVEMLGGKIWLESEQGKGSKFFFTLPNEVEQNPKIDAPDTGTSENENNATKKLNVLIVEDDEVSAILLKTVLKDVAKNITLAYNGEEAIKACKNNPDFDLILMDVKMPGINGFEATREIRKFNKKSIIIVQTAYAMAGDQELAMEAGSNDYISKPINKFELFEKINLYLGEGESLKPSNSH